ncbi:hypothetical protein HNE_2702 [Hyphomonas neptunium ATCC 15444]|uniref:Uncharacterized protein n=1 Tax=Hyphomonas neptunium (strain ATCC 15444) TaxID=228405 RepID=Q0BYR1_HYPNA|nr:hypothetical protein HNE_2702 [Hyphomonas neptunium ATCC 15444]
MITPPWIDTLAQPEKETAWLMLRRQHSYLAENDIS